MTLSDVLSKLFPVSIEATLVCVDDDVITIDIQHGQPIQITLLDDMIRITRECDSTLWWIPKRVNPDEFRFFEELVQATKA